MSNQHAFEVKISRGFITKIDEEQGIVEAIVNTFGILDDGNDMTVLGCAVKSIAERGRRLKVLNSHNFRRLEDVIGIPLEVREVGRDELPQQILDEFPEATGGLWTRTQYLLDTPEGTGAFKRLKVGAVNEYSIGFEAILTKYEKVQWRGKTVNARLLKEIRWWEYSPVVWGMNPATATATVKSDRGKDEHPMGDSKEMTPQGPIARMGDLLQGRMRYVANAYGNDWLAMGKLTSEQVKAINQALDTAMATFVAALPEDVALMPAWSGYYMDSADGPDSLKTMLPVPYPFMIIPGMGQPIPIPDSTKQAELPDLKAGTQAGPSVPETPTQKAGPSQGETPTEDERTRVLKAIEDEMHATEAL